MPLPGARFPHTLLHMPSTSLCTCIELSLGGGHDFVEGVSWC